MDKIRLMPSTKSALPYTIIAEVEIPHFITPPVVIVWGVRVFALSKDNERGYHEVFAYVVPMKVATGPGI